MRLGVLDVGSNTVHLQVVDTSPGARPNPTFNYKEELKLTQYILENNQISDEGVEKLRSSINKFLCRMTYIKIGVWNVKRCKYITILN